MALCWPEINGVKERWARREEGEGGAGQLGDAAQGWRGVSRPKWGREEESERKT